MRKDRTALMGKAYLKITGAGKAERPDLQDLGRTATSISCPRLPVRRQYGNLNTAGHPSAGRISGF